MKHLTILVPEGHNNLSSIVGSYKLFTRANEYWQQAGRKPVFRIQLAGSSAEIEFHDGLFAARPHTVISAIDKTDLVIIPSLNHQYQHAVAANREMIAWIGDQYRNNAAIASICTGAFMLAETGLLDGRQCSTHWSAADHFRQLYPRVKLCSDQLITDENGLITNGGAYSFLNLVIYLIEKYFDRETALYCCKVFQIEPDRQLQSEFVIFHGQKHHDDEMVKQAQDYLEKNAGEKISALKLSSLFATGRRTFDRRFIKATGNTPLEYSQRIRIEQAKKALEVTRKTVNEIMYQVGYSDVKAFREVFRKITGMSPLAYRKRYNREQY